MKKLGAKKTKTKVAKHQKCEICHPETKAGRAAEKAKFNPWHVCGSCGGVYQGIAGCPECNDVRLALVRSKMTPEAISALLRWVRQVADNRAVNAASDAQDSMEYWVEEVFAKRK